jgi:hypothetical protein
MLMVHISYEAGSSCSAAGGSHVGEQRAVTDGHDRLGELQRERAKARPETSRQDERARHPHEYA